MVDRCIADVGSKPDSACENDDDHHREKDSDEPFSVAGNIPVIHVRFPPFPWLDGAPPAKV
jgi:hypothetical protein